MSVEDEYWMTLINQTKMTLSITLKAIRQITGWNTSAKSGMCPSFDLKILDLAPLDQRMGTSQTEI